MISILKKTLKSTNETSSAYSQSINSSRNMSTNLALMTAEERIKYLYDKWGDELVASTSFGLQSCIMLHLISRFAPTVPVIFIDTGYLFPETYRYAEKMASIYNINLHVVSPQYSSARIEAIFGNIWEQDEVGQDYYSRITKLEPMNRALNDVGAKVWMSGLRRAQSHSREGRDFVERQNQILKAYPILDWDDEQIADYQETHKLPAHPLIAKGFVTCGDTHSTKPLHEVSSSEETRFNGNKYECGLHLSTDDSSYLF